MAEVTNTIYEFPAGYWFHSQTGWRPYFAIDLLREVVDSDLAPLESIRAALKEAVGKRLIADGPVGVTLSGRLDSSIVAALARQETSQLHSFSVGVNGSADLAAARKVAEILGTQHHERIYTEREALAALPKIIYHLETFDPAVVRSAVPNFFLAEMASKYVKVILTSEGADDVYAVYNYFYTLKSPDELQEEIIGTVSTLHHTKLQRVDRTAMAFGLEARVPFLDIKSIALGLSLPAWPKIHRDGSAKHLLRQAFHNHLPDEIVIHPKQKFSKGTGSFEIVAEIAEREISDVEFQSERDRLLNRWDYRLENKEALYYYRILHEYFRDQWIFPTMGQSRSL
jgi:asparagine synthase (glutamine-hydrolysing)